MRRSRGPLLACLCAAALAPPARADSIVARWIQLAPGSTQAALKAGGYGDAPTSATPTILARAIISEGACPAAVLDGGERLAMTPRFSGADLVNTPGTAGSTNGKAGYPQFFIDPAATASSTYADGVHMATTSWTECEAVVPPGHHLATIGDATLRLPVAHPRRILVIADTGCRMNGPKAADGSNQQNCHDPAAFPLRFLSFYESLFLPDLIVHVGDYFYRDTNCLTNGTETYPGCNTPTSASYENWGDTFDSWNADWFAPAEPLLRAAPLVLARGNHESCGRGARGWYALLDPHPYDKKQVLCAGGAGKAKVTGTTPVYSGDFEPTYVVPAGDASLMIHDSSFANDQTVDANMAVNYDLDLSGVLTALGPRALTVFTTHKPSFGLGAASTTNFGDFTEQAVFTGTSGYASSAFKAGVPPQIGLFLSGHIHQFEFVAFNDDRRFAPQLIVGNGGSLLDDDILTGTVPSGVVDQSAFSARQYAFTLNEPGGATATTQVDRSYAHDEFGFALLEERTELRDGAIGYDAHVYKISGLRSGYCRINLKPNRDIACNF